MPLALPLNPAAVGYAVAFSLLIGLLVGLVPGLQSTRPNLVPALKDVVTGTRRGRPRLLGALIVL